MLTMPAKLGDSSKPNINQSAISANWFYEIMPKDITSGKPDKLSGTIEAKDLTSAEANKTNATDSKQVAETNDEANNKIESKANENYFSIVLASRVAKKNAEDYVSRLHKKGLKEAAVYTDSNGHTKVIYRKFSTREEANKARNTLTNDVEFEGCWITEIK